MLFGKRVIAKWVVKVEEVEAKEEDQVESRIADEDLKIKKNINSSLMDKEKRNSQFLMSRLWIGSQQRFKQHIQMIMK